MQTKLRLNARMRAHHRFFANRSMTSFPHLNACGSEPLSDIRPPPRPGTRETKLDTGELRPLTTARNWAPDKARPGLPVGSRDCCGRGSGGRTAGSVAKRGRRPGGAVGKPAGYFGLSRKAT